MSLSPSDLTPGSLQDARSTAARLSNQPFDSVLIKNALKEMSAIAAELDKYPLYSLVSKHNAPAVFTALGLYHDPDPDFLYDTAGPSPSSLDLYIALLDDLLLDAAPEMGSQTTEEFCSVQSWVASLLETSQRMHSALAAASVITPQDLCSKQHVGCCAAHRALSYAATSAVDFQRAWYDQRFEIRAGPIARDSDRAVPAPAVDLYCVATRHLYRCPPLSPAGKVSAAQISYLHAVIAAVRSDRELRSALISSPDAVMPHLARLRFSEEEVHTILSYVLSRCDEAARRLYGPLWRTTLGDEHI